MCSINMNYFVFVLAVVVILTSAKSGQSSSTAQPADASEINSLVDKVTVKIVNVLPDGTRLTVHCKSKDDDLGTHVIKNARSYEFEFNNNMFGTTLFFCGASWHGGQVDFDVYNYRRDSKRCKNCRWEGTEDGMIGVHEDGYLFYDIKFPWKH